MLTPRGCLTIAVVVALAFASVKSFEAGRYVIGGAILAVTIGGAVAMNRAVGR